ncbi:phytanoyl-CoA dioxygenase family protein [Novosphingobium sp. FKTRR1]|uniref:phytanoyl-CoA dioxygenase family protein n=1 Tax=Novosphingobium sp. FKTRR1 TaxID=2879118 RepID=UPI001CF03DCA|nr:phytanoyl-CoA dioxygenase family protein [Novosphingobium sp. FKTRR1]
MTRFSDLLPGVPPLETPYFEQLLPELDLTVSEAVTARALHEKGYATIDFPDPEIAQRIDRIKSHLAPQFGIDPANPAGVGAQGQRVQDAWQFDDDVRAIATNPAIIDLLSRLYARPAFPFQTLNFPVGTQQPLHSDSIHFSSQPERFMCGVWLAFEDIHPDAGPLNYCPGSHKWPIITNTMLNRPRHDEKGPDAQGPYEGAWNAMVDTSGLPVERFLARKGQALIWMANLLHGGSPQADPNRTRWSQVTHYYFKDCTYYTPAFSTEPLGKLDLRRIVDISTGEVVPSRLFGEELAVPAVGKGRRIWPLRRRATAAAPKPAAPERAEPAQPQLPADFDSATYLELHPDVAAAGEDAASHYARYGRREGRKYR